MSVKNLFSVGKRKEEEEDLRPLFFFFASRAAAKELIDLSTSWFNQHTTSIVLTPFAILIG